MSTTIEERAAQMRAEAEETAANVNATPIMTTEDNATVSSTARLDVTPIAFNTTCDSKLCTTLQLGELINQLFRPFFRDYVGCNVVLTPVNVPVPNAVGANGVIAPGQPHMVGNVTIPRFEVELYFQEKANGKCLDGAIDNIERLGTGNKSDSMMAKINRINAQAIRGKNYTLTKKTKEMLDEFFMAPYRKNVNVKTVNKEGKNVTEKKSVPRYEDGLVFEVADGYGLNGNLYGTYVKVTNLDAIALLRKIYGAKNELGHKVDYDVKAVRPLNSFGNVPGNALNVLLQISRLDCAEVEEMSKALGLMTVINGLPINRG